jgi:hypothetical protein
MGVRCYIRSAAVKVVALLALPAAVTSVSPRLEAAVLCLRYGVTGIYNCHAVSTNGSISACSERDVAVSCHLVQTFLKMSKQSFLKFDIHVTVHR